MKNNIKLLSKILIIPTACVAPALSSCGVSKSFSNYFLDYSSNFKEWYKWMSENEDDKNHDFLDPNIDETDIKTGAQAILMYNMGCGWETWNDRLHQYGEAGIPASEDDVIAEGKLTIPKTHHGEKRDGWWTKNTKIKVGAYKHMERALRKSKCAKGITYSGAEYNQVDLYGQLNDLFGHPEYSWETTDPNLYRQLDLNLLKGKVITNYGFMSTSMYKPHAWSFLINDYSSGFKNVVFYEIEIDEHTQGAVVSDWNYLFGKNQYMLGSKNEWQIDLNLKLKLRINDAYWTKTIANVNVLYLKCTGYHE